MNKNIHPNKKQNKVQNLRTEYTERIVQTALKYLHLNDCK